MSSRVRDAFARRGWYAVSCDLLPSEGDQWSGLGAGGHADHIQGDVLEYLPLSWDLVIAHPPCDHLSLAGARWWAQKQSDGRQAAAYSFFMAMLELPRPEAYVAVEDPRGWMNSHYRQPDQVVEPWWFGDPYAKKTCLWYRNAMIQPKFCRGWVEDKLPLLQPQNAVSPEFRVATGGGSWKVDKLAGKTGMSATEDSEGRARRAIVRSRTMPGFAQAMADQWGPYVEEKLK
jgi:site-specific DNA-cytosine methylase